LPDTTGVLMEGVPRIWTTMHQASAVAYRRLTGVHDLHIWHMGAERVALSAHLSLADAAEWPVILARAQRLLLENYGIEHVTLQPAWPPPARFGNRRVIPIATNDEKR
jgi:cobalt-zinc-cadmium efflux system protein